MFISGLRFFKVPIYNSLFLENFTEKAGERNVFLIKNFNKV